MATSSILKTVPENQNIFQTTKFTFQMLNLPHIKYFCQTVMLPSVSTADVPQENPFSTIWRAGDKLQYEPLVLTFLVDEDLRNWEEAYNWLRAFTFPHKYAEYGYGQRKTTYHDAILTTYTNSNVPNIRFKFEKCWPMTLGPVQLATSDDANVPPVSDLTIRFDTFTVDRIKTS